MKLNRIKIKHWRGIAELDYTFEDITVIHGPNESGKTTLYDAFLWVLTGVDSHGRTDYRITPFDENNNLIENLENDVTLWVENDGEEIQLRKIRKEVWKKKTGELEKKVTGYSIDYFFDETKVTKREYDSRVQEWVGVKNVQLLTNPLYFSTKAKSDGKVDWEWQRNFLTGMVEIESDLDIAMRLRNEDTRFNNVVWYINKHNQLDDRKTQLKKTISDLNKKVKDIPTRIDQESTNITDVRTVEEVDAEIAKIQEQILEIESAEQSALEAYRQKDQANNEVRDKITMLKTKRYGIEKTIDEQVEKDNAKLRKKQLAPITEKKELESLVEIAKKRVSQIGIEINAVELAQKGYVSQWKEEKAKEFELAPGSTECPTCKRELDNAEDVAAELEQNFNEAKANKIAEIEKKGFECKEKLVKLKDELKVLDADIKDKDVKIMNLSSKIGVDIVKPKEAKYDESTEWLEINETIKSLEVKLVEYKPEINESQQEKKRGLNNEIICLNREIEEINQVDKTKAKIEALRKENKEYASNLIEAQGELDAIQRFEKEKMRLVQDSINEKFTGVSFKLWEYYQNDNDKPTCEILVKGVPFPVVNTAGKTQAGINIIKTLNNYYGVKMPIWVDNKESVSTIPEIDTQIINLVVDENCKELTKK
jgi:exonuclease SbcC